MVYTLVTRAYLVLRGCKDDFDMGECFETGRYVKKDMDAAIFCYRKAANSGHGLAYERLGGLYLQRDDIEQALYCYFMAGCENEVEKLALGGLTRAHYYLGLICEREFEWFKAQQCYQRAIANNDADAMYQMGVLYEQDRLFLGEKIIVADKTKALHWYRKATIAGSKYALEALIEAAKTEAKAAFHIAEMYETREGGIAKNMNKVVSYYLQASKLGNVEADYRLGLIYEIGDEENERDVSIAAHYYLKAAKEGHEKALTQLQLLTEKTKQSEHAYQLGILFEQRNEKKYALLWYKKAANQDHAKASTALKRLAEADPQFAFVMGQAYEKEFADMKQACFYYSIAMGNHNPQAQEHLFSLAEKGEKEAQYAVAYHYYHVRKDFSNAANWCLKAAEANHPEAQQYLKNTSFSPELCLTIAKKYEKGKKVRRNMPQAIEFYIRASQAGDQHAPFRLGQIYESGKGVIQKDMHKSFHYYLIAAKRKHEKALASVEALLKKNPDVEYEYKLGIFCEKIIKNYSAAWQWYKACVDKGKPEATTRLHDLAESNADMAYEIGCSYENAGNLAQAFFYYTIAINKKHTKTIEHIRRLAEAGNPEAQYLLGARYYASEDPLKAAYWCMQAAASQHQAAIDYLKNTPFSAAHCLIIAEQYESGEWGVKNIAQSVPFYKRASFAGEKQASFRLGQFCEEGMRRNKDHKRRAFDYYLLAAKQKHESALTCLEAMLEKEPSEELEYELGQFYEHNMPQNTAGILRWYKLSADKGKLEAATRLQDIANNDADMAYEIGCSYESTGDLTQAFFYYTIALYKKHAKTIEQIRRLAEAKNPEAQYSLGARYYAGEDPLKAAYWCVQAAALQHQAAQDYLKNTPFSAAHCLIIAEKYEWGDWGVKNPASAITFYHRASQGGEKQASFRLGQLFEEGIQRNKDYKRRAFDFYLLAVTQKHESALNCLEAMLEKEPSQELEYRLGQFYEKSMPQNTAGIMRWYKLSADKGYESATRKLRELASKDADFSYELGCSYEKECLQQPAYLVTAIAYYSMAILKKHRKAVAAIRRLAAEGNAQAQFLLGTVCFATINKWEEATFWCMQAAERQHTEAMNYLRVTPFRAEICTLIARRYEQGEKVAKNISLAVEFYIKAAQAGDIEAAFHLGQLYEAGAEGVTPNVGQAYQYYITACKGKHRLAIKSLEALVKTQKNAQWEYEVGLLYEQVLKDKMAALPWYKKATDHGCNEAAEKQEKLSNQDRNYAYALAQAYEQDQFAFGSDAELSSQEEINYAKQQASVYYARAALKDHMEALSHLEQLAQSGNKVAQYALGYHYYFAKGKIDQAIDWCLLAFDQDYKPAGSFLDSHLNAAHNIQIAKKLEAGDGIQQNIKLALKFYKKACSSKSVEALLYLGSFYQIEHEEFAIAQKNDKACKYLIKAAKLGSPEALVSLECLGEDVSYAKQQKISRLFAQKPFKNDFKHAMWAKMAEESKRNASAFSVQHSTNRSLEENSYFYRH